MTMLFIFLKKNMISRRVFKTAVLLTVIVDLCFYSSQFIKSYQLENSEERQITADQLRQGDKMKRVLLASESFSHNDGSIFRFHTLNGYDPLVLSRYMFFLQASQGLPFVKEVIITDFIKNYNHKFLKILNLGYIQQEKGIIKIKDFLPRAFLVKKAIVRPEEKVLDFMKSDEFDPNTMVVFEPEDVSFLHQEHSEGLFHGSCSITEYSNENIKIKATSNQPCYLVLSEMYYPGWKVTVDGKPAPVLRGDYLLRVIPLGEGQHHVEMRFVSRPFQKGALVSIITLLGSVIFLFVKKKPRQKG